MAKDKDLLVELMKRSIIIDNLFNYKFNEKQVNHIDNDDEEADESPQQIEIVTKSISGREISKRTKKIHVNQHTLHLREENSDESTNLVASIAYFFGIMPPAIALSSTYSGDAANNPYATIGRTTREGSENNTYLVYEHHDKLYYISLENEQLLNEIRAIEDEEQKKKHRLRDIINAQILHKEEQQQQRTHAENIAWLTEYLKSKRIDHGWTTAKTIKKLQPNNFQKHAVILAFAMPQMGLLSSMTSFNTTLSLIVCSIATPWFLYECHKRLAIHDHKRTHGGRAPLAPVKRRIEHEASTLFMQTLAASVLVATLMTSDIKMSPSFYKPIHAMMGHWSTQIIGGLPLEVQIGMLAISALSIGLAVSLIGWARNRNNARLNLLQPTALYAEYKWYHYAGIGVMAALAGMACCAASMITVIHGIDAKPLVNAITGASILALGLGLRQVNQSIKPKMVRVKPAITTSENVYDNQSQNDAMVLQPREEPLVGNEPTMRTLFTQPIAGTGENKQEQADQQITQDITDAATEVVGQQNNRDSNHPHSFVDVPLQDSPKQELRLEDLDTDSEDNDPDTMWTSEMYVKVPKPDTLAPMTNTVNQGGWKLQIAPSKAPLPTINSANSETSTYKSLMTYWRNADQRRASPPPASTHESNLQTFGAASTLPNDNGEGIGNNNNNNNNNNAKTTNNTM